MKKILRVVTEIIIGFILAMIIDFVMIWVGYYHFYGAHLNHLNVNILGLSTYVIRRTGDAVSGISNNHNMMILSVICSILMVVIGETFFWFHRKSKTKK
ncbi:LlsX family protein [Fructilactobacillus fructivorans]|nr:LlsX family protein [Fructilactobacillus fructivorans]KRK56918.1 hypothetical protein FC73_GL001312 [Fructilactobacillus fructivorans]KRN13198.1 hypothetical protein IV37_GL000840 [Fructilactobacillus fructivorans]KRN41217.1 hypothetical protein IV51_GL000535 [Fructilactobacillus fructivorans]RDV65050.1 hypothetical protein DXU76_03415 [Fructilactobacillus fructivorans]